MSDFFCCFVVMSIKNMKNFTLLIILVLTACHQKESVVPAAASKDSIGIHDANVDTTKTVSIPDATIARHSSDSSRAISGDKIVRTIGADVLPINIQDEFTNDDQQLIIKIKNFSAKSIAGKINPENPEMNIRFNQIKLPNGDYDGPFGRDVSYDINGKGELWLIIGKSNMASADPKGKFSVKLQ